MNHRVDCRQGVPAVAIQWPEPGVCVAPHRMKVLDCRYSFQVGRKGLLHLGQLLLPCIGDRLDLGDSCFTPESFAFT